MQSQCSADFLTLFQHHQLSHLIVDYMIVNTYPKPQHLNSGKYIKISFPFSLSFFPFPHYNRNVLGVTPGLITLGTIFYNFTSVFSSDYQVVRCEHVAGKAGTKPNGIILIISVQERLRPCAVPHADMDLGGMR